MNAVSASVVGDGHYRVASPKGFSMSQGPVQVAPAHECLVNQDVLPFVLTLRFFRKWMFGSPYHFDWEKILPLYSRHITTETEWWMAIAELRPLLSLGESVDASSDFCVWNFLTRKTVSLGQTILRPYPPMLFCEFRLGDSPADSYCAGSIRWNGFERRVEYRFTFGSNIMEVPLDRKGGAPRYVLDASLISEVANEPVTMGVLGRLLRCQVITLAEHDWLADELPMCSC